jgi:hypothetical protein
MVFTAKKTGRALAQVTDEKQLEGRELEDEGAYRAWRLDDGARTWRDFSKRVRYSLLLDRRKD